MKKKDIKLRRVLSLDREIIVKLDEKQLGAIEGGGGQVNNPTTQTEQSSCAAFSCNPVAC
jgi:hypothetical protein